MEKNDPASSDAGLSAEDLALATLWWIRAASRAKVDDAPVDERMRGPSTPCDGTCARDACAEAFKQVGNDAAAAREASSAALFCGIATRCPGCSQRYLGLAEAFSYHVRVIVCNASRDDVGLLRAARARAEALRQAGCRRA